MKKWKGEKGEKGRTFEDLAVWISSCELTVNIYKHFSTLKDRGFRDQVCRAAVSIPSNIAEGFERGSTQEFIRYLYISKGSAGELRTQLILAMELRYIERNIGLQNVEHCKKISGMIQNLITSLRKKTKER